MILRLIRILGLSLSVVFMAGQAVLADVVDDIKARGKLIVGVKADYKPYGFRDTSGKVVGIEPELAQDVADKGGFGLWQDIYQSLGNVEGTGTTGQSVDGKL